MKKKLKKNKYITVKKAPKKLVDVELNRQLKLAKKIDKNRMELEKLVTDRNISILKEFQVGVNSGRFNDGRFYYMLKRTNGELWLAISDRFELAGPEFTLTRLHMQIS